MKHAIRYVGVAMMCGLLMFAVGCSCSTQASSQDPVPAQDEGAEIDLDGGWLMYAESDLVVLLDENATTGYEWTSEIEGSAVTADADQAYSAEEANPLQDGEVVGGTGAHMFSYKGAAAGDGTITLTYARSWEQTDDDKKIVLQVKTGQNGVIESVRVA